jgi:hypothetical protein
MYLTSRASKGDLILCSAGTRMVGLDHRDCPGTWYHEGGSCAPVAKRIRGKIPVLCRECRLRHRRLGLPARRASYSLPQILLRVITMSAHGRGGG